MRHFLTIAVLLLTAVGCKAQTAQQWRDSLVVLNRMIEQQPRSTDLRLRKAAVNIELEQWEYAVEEYGRVLAIDDSNPAALYFRAYANVHLRQYTLARADYEKLLTLLPLHMEARLGLAAVYERMARWRNAADEYNLLVEMFPDSAVCYAARAAFEVSQKQYELAVYDLEQAVKRSPQDVSYRASLADVRRKLRRGR